MFNMFRFFLLGLTLIVFTSKETLADRIVGGTNVTIEEISYQVSLQTVLPNEEIKHICGGSILSERVVLTAAHCLNYFGENSTYYIRYASNDYESGGTLIKVNHTIRHEKYIVYLALNDIALVILNEPIQFSEKASRVELSTSTESIPAKEMVTISGWGHLKAREHSKYLQKVQVPMVDLKECLEIAAGFTQQIFPGMICAGFIGTEGKGACGGDSGGPLTWNGKQYGVVSWGFKHCARGYPDVYSDVAHYRKWIDSKMQKYN